ncbi:uncharacterized protein UV8b_05356 [Ustilaginoidea virens]|uniref:DSBA-like thioredoxin domain-containing protein n=1 Tax=Ustilaginoidea virens TaxID=1159556 RepID=A0A8E5HTM5_USTVR|nr:uncharacterized protein UV8b_05356 [Ustilaginoidea virens]QUC21113.1 hypothetical protein UV8b_05356 [Ustilaginoidea virens]
MPPVKFRGVPLLRQERLLIPIEVFSDSLCPWCWVEKQSLEEATRQFGSRHPEVEFEVVWRSFCLNPLFKTKCDKVFLYDEWSGGQGRFQAHLDRVAAAGARYGVKFSVSGVMGPSRSSQILIANVLRRRGPAAQARVVEALFRAHFLLGQDLSDEDFLVRLGSETAGLPADLVRADLRDGDNGRLVDCQAEEAVEEKGVEAVPCVTVLGKYKVGGFQDAHVFEELFDRIWEENKGLLGGIPGREWR